MSSPQTYTIDVSQTELDKLNHKLSQAEFSDQLEGSTWDLGSPRSDIEHLVKAWKQWDWRQAEKKLNELPHFHVEIAVDRFKNLDIHFIHQRSDVAGAIPLLFVHGWPGSFIEVQKILPLLAQRDSSSPAFHVVAPSLPNFGFSQGVSKRGFALAQYAETCHKLMARLGYKEYVTQGGDWGFWVTRAIGKRYPESCKASHMNMIYAKPPAFSKNPLLTLQHAIRPYSPSEKKGLERSRQFETEGFGYNLLQSTKPNTLSLALYDSPLALLSWISEKLHTWSDAYPWTPTELLTWISIYQFSRAGPGAAHRIYYEVFHDNDPAFAYDGLLQWNGDVKLGFTRNPMEIHNFPKTWGRALGNVVFERENPHGGHFYAHEHPDLLVRDLRQMFGKGGGAYGVVRGKDGY